MIILPGWSGAMGAPRSFSPASLFANSETGVWLKSSDIASLFQLSNGTTDVAANNDPVGYWADQSGNDNHVIQATAGSRPLYQSAVPGVLFDGTNDVLSCAASLAMTTGVVAVTFTIGDPGILHQPAMVLVSTADVAAAKRGLAYTDSMVRSALVQASNTSKGRPPAPM